MIAWGADFQVSLSKRTSGQPFVFGTVAGRETRMESRPDDAGHDGAGADADGDSVVGVVQADVECIAAALANKDGEGIWPDGVVREALRRIPDAQVPDASHYI